MLLQTDVAQVRSLWDLYLADDVANSASNWSPERWVQMLKDRDTLSVNVITNHPSNRDSTEIELWLHGMTHDGPAKVYWHLRRAEYDAKTCKAIVVQMRRFFPENQGEDICRKLQITRTLGTHPLI